MGRKTHRRRPHAADRRWARRHSRRTCQLLLDRHVFLRYITADAGLPAAFLAAIQDPANEVFLSVASVWEAVIKHGLGKLPLPGLPEEYLPRRENGRRQPKSDGVAGLRRSGCARGRYGYIESFSLFYWSRAFAENAVRQVIGAYLAPAALGERTSRKS